MQPPTFCPLKITEPPACNGTLQTRKHGDFKEEQAYLSRAALLQNLSRSSNCTKYVRLEKGRSSPCLAHQLGREQNPLRQLTVLTWQFRKARTVLPNSTSTLSWRSQSFEQHSFFPFKRKIIRPKKREKSTYGTRSSRARGSQLHRHFPCKSTCGTSTGEHAVFLSYLLGSEHTNQSAQRQATHTGADLIWKTARPRRKFTSTLKALRTFSTAARKPFEGQAGNKRNFDKTVSSSPSLSSATCRHQRCRSLCSMTMSS